MYPCSLTSYENLAVPGCYLKTSFLYLKVRKVIIEKEESCNSYLHHTDIVLHHPGLRFLADNPMFQERYSKFCVTHDPPVVVLRHSLFRVF